MQPFLPDPKGPEKLGGMQPFRRPEGSGEAGGNAAIPPQTRRVRKSWGECSHSPQTPQLYLGGLRGG
jgi:hypothetical protein